MATLNPRGGSKCGSWTTQWQQSIGGKEATKEGIGDAKLVLVSVLSDERGLISLVVSLRVM